MHDFRRIFECPFVHSKSLFCWKNSLLVKNEYTLALKSNVVNIKEIECETKEIYKTDNDTMKKTVLYKEMFLFSREVIFF